MSVKASGGSPIAKPQLYRTACLTTILQAEQQDRFLQIGELNELVTFLNSGNTRLTIANVLTKNANFLVAKAADKIFIGGSAISYLERPQTPSISVINEISDMLDTQELSGSSKAKPFDNLSSLFTTSESTPPGFKPISINRYGTSRMKKSLRDLDWFLRYLTYAIIAGDPNILAVNIRGLRELIDNACSSAAATVALREMRQVALGLFLENSAEFNLVEEYFNVIITEFEAASLTDKFRKRESKDLQGLRLPQVYAKAGLQRPRFVMKTSLSASEKENVIRACYRQVFERDISKGYSLSFTDLESQVKNGQISVKEFIRKLGMSDIYRKQFVEPFVNSRVIELAFRHFLGRGPSSLIEFQRFFAILSIRGVSGLIDALINSAEYTDYFGEETVPYQRSLGEEPQECRNWGPQINLLNYSAPFNKIPQFITLFSAYTQALPDQHPYGKGNDPLLIQFGAIFNGNPLLSNSKPAPFGKDTRRLLTRLGPGIYNQISRPDLRAKETGSLGPIVFKADKGYTSQTLIQASYLRIFGRAIYKEEQILFKELETQVARDSLSIKEFIRQLAKSSVFRRLYWEPLYICKAIEYIHNRILGRPTYGRQEINQYFDIAYKNGYYVMIDAMIDSIEYQETFGDNTIPYERYLTANTIAMRQLRQITSITRKNLTEKQSQNNKFIKLGQVRGISSLQSIIQKVDQGVSSKRDQIVIFKQTTNSTQLELETLFKAACKQIFERDIYQLSLGYELYNTEQAFLNNDLTVQQLVIKLGMSQLYCKEFYQPFPNSQVIEFGTKHFLGRAPNSQAEIRYYNQILAASGLPAFIESLTNNAEYQSIFGKNIVPYRRFPTLPAANFPNTEKLYNKQTRQDAKFSGLNFPTVKGNA